MPSVPCVSRLVVGGSLRWQSNARSVMKEGHLCPNWAFLSSFRLAVAYQYHVRNLSLKMKPKMFFLSERHSKCSPNSSGQGCGGDNIRNRQSWGCQLVIPLREIHTTHPGAGICCLPSSFHFWCSKRGQAPELPAFSADTEDRDSFPWN